MALGEHVAGGFVPHFSCRCRESGAVRSGGGNFGLRRRGRCAALGRQHKEVAVIERARSRAHNVACMSKT